MQCNQLNLTSLLADDDLPGNDPRAEHIADCPHCRRQLAELSGEESDWSELSDILKEGFTETPQRNATDSSVVILIDPSLSDDVPATCEPLSLSFLESPSHPEMLGRLGRYEIERVIGTGGHGVVLKGFDTELHRPVAIKVLAPHLAGSGAARTRFAREAQAAAAIVHDHVIPIHDVATGETLPYLVMPFVPGRSLQQRIDDEGPLPVKEIVRVAMQTATGLAAAHRQGIIHRDVKPANILLEDEVDRVLISDFGLARTVDDASLTRSGIIAGTPQYMSPEQTRGEAIDAASDLFSLGSVIYAMCTGRSPFRADTTMGVLRKISDWQPRPIREVNDDVPAWLEWIVERLLAKQPSDRFSSAAEVADLLERCLAHLHRPAEQPLPAALQKIESTSGSVSRNSFPLRSAAAAVGGMAITLAMVAAFVWNPWRQSTNQTADDSLEVRQPQAFPGESGSSQAETLEPKVDWNGGIEEQLIELEYETEQLEQNVKVPFLNQDPPSAKETQ